MGHRSPDDKGAGASEMARGPLRWFWFSLGVLALVLGAIGVVLPILPTTPFVILAAFAFSKSSPRLQAWLEGSKVFGPSIARWREHGAIAWRHKVMALVMMGGVLIFSVVSGFSTLVITIQAAAISAAAAFILTRPSGPHG